MLGMMTLLVALGIQIGFLVWRLRTGNWQTRAMHTARIAGFLTFLALMLVGVYQWGFRWMGLFFILLVLAGISGLYFLRKPKKEKIFRARAAVLAFVGGSLLLAFNILPGILFPQFLDIAPTGQYAIASRSVTFVDDSRVDPFSKTDENRKLTAQYWYPQDAGRGERFPLLVFSHGAFGYRGSNLSTFRELASRGYVVCSIDHSGHAFFAKHDDGSLSLVDMNFLNDAVDVTNGGLDLKTTYDKTHAWLTLRAADMNFILDETLQNKDEKLPYDIAGRIDPDKIGLFGHSLGGATAACLGRERGDADAVIVIDGTMFGEETGIADGSAVLNPAPYPLPLLNLYNQEHDRQARQQGLSYPNLSAAAGAGEAYEAMITGAGHLNFTDLPLFSPALARLLGTGSVDSRYAIQTMNGMILQFFDHTLKGGPEMNLKAAY